MVTGSRFLTRNAPQVRLPKSAAVLPMASQKPLAAPLLMNRPIGTKYMLAMLCSNPAATKAEIGKMIARILSVVDRADEQLGPSDDDGNEAQTEGEASQKLDHSIPHAGFCQAGGYDGGKDCPRSDKGPGQDSEGKHGPCVQFRLLDAYLFHPMCHLGRRKSVNIDIVSHSHFSISLDWNGIGS